jgi:hypothetical protein
MLGWVRESELCDAKQEARECRAELGSVRRELELARDPQLLPGVPLDVCPECGQADWARLATIVGVQHDGHRAHSAPQGARLVCLCCNTQYNHKASGLERPKTHTPPASAPDPNARPVERPGTPHAIPVRLPRARA